jgi:hypothetical protein
MATDVEYPRLLLAFGREGRGKKRIGVSACGRIGVWAEAAAWSGTSIFPFWASQAAR